MKKELLFTLTLLLGISTVFAQRTSGPNFSTDISVTRDKGIYLSGSPIADPHHGIKYSYSEFANTFVDGPVIFGYSGGALGTNNSFTTSQTIALR
ncbi:hypothetical protein [Chishuiella sp.]|uniref:hypothetical protein n=1 Tax=Chishuiella sp. TaxID=1969467 RepID=UPI0028B23370|nr:hypothetical protein [Chishuiella sp.]